MQLLGISSYPVRWRRILWTVILLDITIVLEGIGTLIWFVANPSESESRVFLAYSFERWFLIFAVVAIIFLFLFLLWAIKFRTERIESQILFFEQPKHAHRLLTFVTLLFVISTGLMMWLPRNEAIQFYWARLLPLLLWVTVILAQVWIFLVVSMWQAVVQVIKSYSPVNQEKQIYSIQNTNRYLFFALIGMSFVYLILQFRSYLAIREAVLIGDSWSYLQGASLKLNDPAFFSDRRPWGILLIYNILGSSQAAIEVFQLSFSILAWLGLAWAFVRSLKNDWVKFTGFIVTLGFSLSPTVQLWNHAVLSESLSISVMIFILAVFVILSQQWKGQYLVWLTLLFAFWMSLREVNAYIALSVAFLFLFLGLIQRALRVYWLISFVIGITFWVNYQFSSATALPRWALPLAEVITHRILPDQEYLKYFSDSGMPVTQELMALSGRNATSDNFAVVNNIRLKGFSRWLFNDARNVYVKFLFEHPIYTITSPFMNIKTLLGYDYFEGVPIPDYIPALPKQVNEMFYPMRWFWIYCWLSLFTVSFIVTVNLRTKRRIYWIILVFLLLAIPQLYLIWHGDALDVERHAVVMNIQVHLGLWWLIIIYIDTVLKNRRGSIASISC